MTLSPDDIDALYRTHARAMVTFFARRTLDPEAAVDLVAETFAVAIAERRRCRGTSDEQRSAWLYGIARNHLNGWYRRGAIERRALERVGLERPALTDVDVERLEDLAELAELRAWVADLLRHLPADARRALELRVVAELSYEEVAEQLGVSQQVVRARVSRALRLLGDQLEPAWRVTMPEPDDLPVLDALGDAVRRAARRAEHQAPALRAVPPGRVRRWSPRILALGALLVLPAAAASAGATLLVLRGAVIPAPQATPPEQTPAPGTSRLVAFTAADPQAERPRWRLRLATSRTGLLCSTVAQQVDGAFGIVGLDDRFRALSPDGADACSIKRSNASSLVGARVFDARRPADVRTVVSGVAGSTLRTVRIEAGGRRRTAAVHAGGTFLAALTGFPEDLGLRVSLGFADGHREQHPFGVSPMVLADPDGGRAWRIENAGIGGDNRTCVSLRQARERLNPVLSPAACGRLEWKLGPKTAGGRRSLTQRGVYFAVRRVVPGTGGIPITPFGEGRWQRTPPRLIVLGAAGNDVASLTVRGPAGAPHTGTWFRPNGSFAFMYGPHVRSGAVTVTVRFKDGRRIVRTTSTNLLPPPTFGRHQP